MTVSLQIGEIFVTYAIQRQITGKLYVYWEHLAVPTEKMVDVTDFLWYNRQTKSGMAGGTARVMTSGPG